MLRGALVALWLVGYNSLMQKPPPRNFRLPHSTFIFRGTSSARIAAGLNQVLESSW